MISVDDAFKKFRSRLELTDREQDDASRRHNEIREYLKSKFDIKRNFLTGSYKRWTKTKPLKDVDIFCVLGEKEKDRRNNRPQTCWPHLRMRLSSSTAATRFPVSVGRWLSTSASNPMQMKIPPAR